jgi:hypothetical protein
MSQEGAWAETKTGVRPIAHDSKIAMRVFICDLLGDVIVYKWQP